MPRKLHKKAGDNRLHGLKAFSVYSELNLTNYILPF